jgi:DnaJ family protein C protein 17
MSEKQKNEFMQMDLYKLLNVEETSTVEEIKKAYRKRALELHPDKNLGNKEEAEKKFIELGKAFELLADSSARAAYDAVRRQKREKEKRDRQLDEKQRKLREKLESREKAYKERSAQQTEQLKKNVEEERLQREVERLRKEGSRILEDEMNLINEQIRLENLKRAQNQETEVKEPSRNKSPNLNEHQVPRIKATWSAQDSNKIRLDESLLNYLFEKYGQIDVFVMNKKSSSALIEYKTYADAIKCINDQNYLSETYGVKIKCLDQKKLVTNVIPTNLGCNENSNNSNNNSDLDNNQPEALNGQQGNEFNFASFEDMEAAILKKLKSAT